MEAFTLGPLLIKINWIIFVMAGISTYFTVKITLKENKSFQKTYIDEFLHAIIVGFLVYKFSRVLFRPSIIWNNPIEIVYFTGGSKGIIAGTIVAALTFIWRGRKHQWETKLMFRGLTITSITFVVSSWILHTVFSLLL